MRRWIGLFIVMSLLLGGCASGPNPKLVEAQTAVAELGADEDISDLAPVTAAEARDLLSRAERAGDDAQTTHRAQLSLLKVQTARAQARKVKAQARAEASNRKAEELELDARAREAQDALRRAAEARRQALQAQRRAEELRQAAAAERAQAQAAREQARLSSSPEAAPGGANNRDPDPDALASNSASASNRLEQIQQTLAELKPRLGERGLVLTLGEVLFIFDSANLKPYTQRIVDRLAGFLADFPRYRIAVEGHTDSEGSAASNAELSSARARVVTQALVARGIDTSRIRTTGYGETRPVASNQTEVGRRKNRRVEVILSQN